MDELARTVANLAEANRHLAAAHNVTLENLRWIFETDRRERLGPKPACATCKGKTRLAVGRQSHGKPTNRSAKRPRKILVPCESKDTVDFSVVREIESNLRREIQALNDSRLETLTKNEKLTNHLEEQRLLIERLTRKIEDSERESAGKDKSLEEALQKLRQSELERARLLAELEAFQAPPGRGTGPAEEPEEAPTTGHDDADAQLGASTSSSSSTTAADQEQFRKELMLKREARQRAIAAISSEIYRLRCELKAEKSAHAETAKLLQDLRELRSKTDDADLKTDNLHTPERVEALRLLQLLKVSDEVTSELWLQLERTDDLRFQLENDPEEHRLRIASLKRLAEETRSTLRCRKLQVNQLKDRLAQLLVRLGDRCFLDDNDDIKEEAERQLEDMARSRGLGDERSRILAELKDYCFKQIHELKLKLNNSKKDNFSLEEDLQKTEDKMGAQNAEILNLESQLGLAKADCRDLQNQMSLINSLFTQMLLSASSAEMDLDRLTQLLQENHDLISDVAKENGTEAAALPKLLLDIIEQVDGRSRESPEKKEEDGIQGESIAHNLPKVWRVLLELISCHAAGTSAADSAPSSCAESAPDSCYKSVDTPTGPRLVISVSKTYIRLKELILEKKHLEKEMNRMKQLNTHLESKLSEQERRLSTVSDELSKTWNIVGRMQAQHQQLHTHEKILRYELQQKRKMLQELKQELEYCREKWESARQKNTNTEIEWRSLRREFAARKALVTHADSFNNSGESGFSDEREEESDEDDDADVGKRIRPINSRRRSRKDGSRAITPDTDTELPTDTEFSECKTTSSITSGLRTPTPETEAELENSEIVEEDSLQQTSPTEMADKKMLDPLDKALTTVIENLIETNENRYEEASSSFESNNEKIDSTENTKNEIVREKKQSLQTVEEAKNVESFSGKTAFLNNNVEKTDESVVSVFSIGPFPSQTVPVKNVQFSNPLVVGPSNKTLDSSFEITKDSIDATNFIDERVHLAKNIDLQNTEEINEESLNPLTVAENANITKISETVIEKDNVSLSSSSSLETVRELTSDPYENNAASSSCLVSDVLTKEIERKSESLDNQKLTSVSELTSTEVLDARAARLRNLEEQAEWLVKKVSATNRRGSALSSRLEELHETYGSMPTAPPMPDVLPVFRIQTVINETLPENISASTENSVPSSNEYEKEPDNSALR